MYLTGSEWKEKGQPATDARLTYPLLLSDKGPREFLKKRSQHINNSYNSACFWNTTYKTEKQT